VSYPYCFEAEKVDEIPLIPPGVGTGTGLDLNDNGLKTKAPINISVKNPIS
jgi:hypothetical protein